MPNIPGLPEKFHDAKGVQFNAPPDHLLPSITAAVKKAGEQITPGDTGRVVWIAQKIGDTKSVNVAVVSRHFDGKLELMHWIGKEWGTPQASGLAGGTMGSFAF